MAVSDIARLLRDAIAWHEAAFHRWAAKVVYRHHQPVEAPDPGVYVVCERCQVPWPCGPVVETTEREHERAAARPEATDGMPKSWKEAQDDFAAATDELLATLGLSREQIAEFAQALRQSFVEEDDLCEHVGEWSVRVSSHADLRSVRGAKASAYSCTRDHCLSVSRMWVTLRTGRAPVVVALPGERA